MSNETPQRSQTKFEYIVLLLLIGFFAYLPSLFGPFIWDDEDFVFANTYVREFRLDKFFTAQAIEGRGKQSNYYRPIQLSIYSTIYKVVGPNPLVFHAVSIIAHFAAATVIFLLFFQLSRSYLQAFLISVIFLVHPVQTEAVSYISGFSDSLFVLFGILSLLLYRQKRTAAYSLSAVFFLLSLLSKETGIVFLGIIVALHFIEFRRHSLIRLLPFFMLAAVYLWFHFTFINVSPLESTWANSVYAHSIFTRVFTFIQNLWLYFSLLVFPKELFMERDFTVSVISSPFTWQVLAVVLLNVLAITLLYFRRNSKYFQLMLLSYGCFYTAFAPYTGIFLINGIFYEHFLYLPLVFFFSFFIFSVNSFKKPAIIIMVVIIVAFALRSYMRQWEWIDSVRFYSQTLEHAPNSVRVRNGLAIAYAEKGEYDQAIKEYKLAIQEDPTVPNMYHNLANVYLAQEKYQEAEKLYLQAIKVDPHFYYSYQSLISLYQKTDQIEKEKALRQKIAEKF